MSNTEQTILVKIYEELKETKEQVKEISKIKEDILEMKKQVQKIPEIEKQVQKIPEMEKQIGEIQNEIKEIKQEQRNISGSVARIEVEHGEKLVALFDAFKINTEKIEQQDKKIIKCENVLEKHDNQMYILNSKVENKKIKNA